MAAIGFGCSKEEDIFVRIEQPTSSFKTYIAEPNYPKLRRESSVVLLDSAVYFKNLSDSSQTSSYQWDFGDGTTSTERHPVHSYTKKGKYKVKLITANYNKAFDTASVTITAVVGQKNIALGPNVNNSSIDVVETVRGFLLLGRQNDATVYTEPATTYLMQLDENMNKVSIKTYPSTTRFNSISATNDGNVVLTGTTTGAGQNNQLIKLDQNGTLLWARQLGENNSYSKAVPTPDNGYLLTGSRNPIAGTNGTPQTVLLKTDAEGNKVWEKLLNEEVVMQQAYNTVVENDGYVLAGLKGKGAEGLACSYCDSLVIAKFNTNGALTWKNTIAWAINSDNLWDTKISKLQNGQYVVINSNARGLYFFSATGAFLDRKLLSNTTYAHTGTKAGNLVVLNHEWGNGFRASVTGLSPEGIKKWEGRLDGSQTLQSGGIRCCSDSWPVTIHALKNGGSIMLANRVDQREGSYSYIDVPVLLQFDETGQIQ
ncbi:PKD domain-containing protein [Rufibacter psychrotolerans]|uniref:PKD domain-containing protein n=1 Tax=Rufibacter psychrotolerans TaxID=2812556 RepID=UPI0021D43907|nr:PKD domain-containing protein [Rufibacter sp. SYSU D00308]